MGANVVNNVVTWRYKSLLLTLCRRRIFGSDLLAEGRDARAAFQECNLALEAKDRRIRVASTVRREPQVPEHSATPRRLSMLGAMAARESTLRGCA